MKCILASGNGFELSQREYPDYDEAYKVMQGEYDKTYNEDLDEEDESYCDSFSARVVVTGEDVFLWDIIKVSKDNEILWKDIVYVDGKYYYFVVPVEFENDVHDIDCTMEETAILAILGDKEVVYNCDKFFEYVEQTLGCTYDDIKTYSFDDIDVPKDELERLHADIAWLGGYINGLNI